MTLTVAEQEHKKSLWQSVQVQVVYTQRTCNILFVIYSRNLRKFQRFPEDFPAFYASSEDFWQLCEDRPKVVRTFPMIFGKFPKIGESFQTTPKISEEDSKMFQWHTSNFYFLKQFKGAKMSLDMMSSIHSHVKISYPKQCIEIRFFKWENFSHFTGVYIIKLPPHGCLLHGRVSSDGPKSSQFLPFSDGTGFEQVLWRICCPPPHVSLHEPHSFHSE